MAMTAAEALRDYETDGVPSSGPHQVKKSDLRNVIGNLEILINAGGIGGAVWKQSKALLTADLAHASGTLAVVYDDPASANNGMFVKAGASGSGSWSQITTFLPGYQFVTATDDGNSTANAYTMDTSPRLPFGDGVALVELVVPVTNTSSTVTVSFDGDAPLTIKTASGNDPSIGGLIEGMLVSGVKVGPNFYMRSDQASAAIQVASEAAAAEAQAWAEGTEPSGAGSKSSREWSEAAEDWALTAQGAVTYNRVSVRGTINSGIGPYEVGVSIGSANNIDIKVGGVIFDHDLYTIDGTTFTFLTDPGAGQLWEAVVQSEVRQLGAPSDGTVGYPQLQDTLRRRVDTDATISSINASRSVGQPLFMATGIADGFGGSGGIEPSASSGYELDAANGRVTNAGSSQPNESSLLPLLSLDENSGGLVGSNLRQRFEAARIATGGNEIRILFRGGSSGAVFSSAYAGTAGSGANFDGSQVPLTFDGGSSTLTLSASEAEWSDWVEYDLTAGMPFIVSGHCSSGGTVGRISSTDADFTLYYKAGADDSGATVASGYSPVLNDLQLVQQIQVRTTTDIENIELVTTPYSYSAAIPAVIKVTGIIEALDVLTLNEDVTLEVSRDGGASWSMAEMAQVYELGAKTYFTTEPISVADQPSGHDISLRYKTYGQKRCFLHGVRTEVLE